MSASKLLFKLTRNSLVQQYHQAHDVDIGRYITADELEDILEYINEHTKLGIASPRWRVSTILFPVCIAFTVYSAVTASDNGFNTIYIALACTIIAFVSIFGLTFISNKGIYPEFVAHINDVNLKYSGKVSVRLEKAFAGFTAGQSNTKNRFDYNVYMYGLGNPSGSSSASPSVTSSPDPVYSRVPSTAGSDYAAPQQAPTVISGMSSDYQPALQSSTVNSYANMFAQPARQPSPVFGQPATYVQPVNPPVQTYLHPSRAQSLVQPVQPAINPVFVESVPNSPPPAYAQTNPFVTGHLLD
ncbi:hypothetical protein HDV01_002327 [Terramyces sp. JEL0728]|nr:hypothetical protein HDV01_002327 [Terramyces sp. JEL0728]